MKRLLIANRGEIARRIQRSAHALGISTVAVYSDADALAWHVQDADQAVRLPGVASADTYLRIDKLLEAARASGADAVHPGYGFLSENAEFAEAVEAAGLIWVGPPAAAIRALGNKSRAKDLALARQVPCLPGYQGEDQSDARFAHEAAAIGYPVMVKAAAGGGGRGMRLVATAEQLLPALASARSEALSGFGSDQLLIERALLRPRHVEVQVFADRHGHCIHLGERDCSVQRRHQKIIEESPSPAVSEALRARMGECAVALAQAAGYVGAGTVEFLLEGEAFYLMEMNTRLQVEHPVTEMVTGLDLVDWQLRVARGEPLPATQADIRLQGHAIEVRLCAEDERYVPHAGRVACFEPPRLHASLRLDHALRSGDSVPPYYDSMVGKLIAHGATRAQAIDRLVQGLEQTVLLGLPSNRRFLLACLEDPVFRAGQALIPFLAEQAESLRARLAASEQPLVPLAMLAVCYARGLPQGCLPSPFERPLRLRHRGETLQGGVRELPGGALLWRGADGEVLAQADTQADARAGATMAPPSLDAGAVVHWRMAEQRHAVRLCALGAGRWQVQIGAVDLLLEDASFEPAAQAGAASGASEIRAPFNGKLIRLAVQPGQSVQRGEPLLVLESMKLEHVLPAPSAAVVRAVAVEVGQQVGTGQLLLRLEPSA